MKLIGVIADTHGNLASIKRAIDALPKAELWIHLGDNAVDARELERLSEKPVYVVRGNGDFDQSVAAERVLQFGGVRILITHGHSYGVRYSRDRLLYRAEELACKLALYGHTHISLVEAMDGILAVNPGSPSLPRGGRKPSIARVTLEGNDCFPSIITL